MPRKKKTEVEEMLARARRFRETGGRAPSPKAKPRKLAIIRPIKPIKPSGVLTPISKNRALWKGYYRALKSYEDAMRAFRKRKSS